MYMLRVVWDGAGVETKFALANLGQVPSYISLTTALDYYGITTQVQRDYFESIAVKRTKEISITGAVFRYVRIAGDLYFGFIKEKGFFIATPEKALLDGFYLMSFGRYAMDLAALDTAKLDSAELARLSKRFPMRTQNLLRQHGYLKTT
jgi:predicted transcriptional regulator of viral defense system